MRYITASLTLCLVILLGACVPSLHPLYTDNDVVFDSAILGEWVEVNSKDNSLTFIKADDNGYKLIQAEGSSKKTAYLAHLVKLTGKLFLDIEPDPHSECDCVCAPFHMFFYVSQIEPTLKIWDFNDKWLEAFLRKNPSALSHEFVGKDLWLTAPPKKLQAFFLKHLNTKDALTEPVNYARKR